MAACRLMGPSTRGEFVNLQGFKGCCEYQPFRGNPTARSDWHNGVGLQAKTVGEQSTNDASCELPTLLRSRFSSGTQGGMIGSGSGANKVLDSSGLSTRPLPPPGLVVPTKSSAAGTVANASEQLGVFESLIKSCTRSGDVSRAEEHLSAMREANVGLTVEALNAMIHVCTQSDRMETAEQYVLFMENSGIGSNVVSYNSVINACACRADLQRVAFWFDKMIARGLLPNEITYGTLCKALARHGEAAKIEKLIEALEEAGMALNEYFYASLISACMQSKPVDITRAERALKDMVSRNFSARRVRGPLTRCLGKDVATELLCRVLKSTKSTEPGPVSSQVASDASKTACEGAVETLSQPVSFPTSEKFTVSERLSRRDVLATSPIGGSRRSIGSRT